MNLPKFENILLIGSTGNVGSVLVDELKKLNVGNIISPIQDDLDYFNRDQLKSYIDKYMPEVIYLVGAYTNVDKAEEEDKELCFKVNVNGIRAFLRNLVEIHDDHYFDYKPTVVYISTEMVGSADKPLEEDTNVWDPPVALNEYGKTKAQAEKVVIDFHENNPDVFDYRIIRICFPIAGWRKGSIFTLLKNTIAEGKNVSLVADEIQTLTYIPYTANNSILAVAHGENGVYHDAMLPKSNGRGYSPYEMGVKFAELMGYDTSLIGQMVHQDMYDKGWWIAPRGLSAELKVHKGLDIEGWKSDTMENIIKDFVGNLR